MEGLKKEGQKGGMERREERREGRKDKRREEKRRKGQENSGLNAYCCPTLFRPHWTKQGHSGRFSSFYRRFYGHTHLVFHNVGPAGIPPACVCFLKELSSAAMAQDVTF